jgi:Fur family ferric uptake transcriptional regulator
MRRHRDLVNLLRASGMRITSGRRLLLQFVLDNKARRITLAEIHAFVDAQPRPIDRASVYRNIEAFKRLGILQELRLPDVGKCFQYVLDRKVHHFYICKVCGKAKPGDRLLFERIEAALKEIHGFSKANLSAVFYGTCAKCAPKDDGAASKKEQRAADAQSQPLAAGATSRARGRRRRALGRPHKARTGNTEGPKTAFLLNGGR